MKANGITTRATNAANTTAGTHETTNSKRSAPLTDHSVRETSEESIDSSFHATIGQIVRSKRGHRDIVLDIDNAHDRTTGDSPK